jgi:hypothetical protein
MASKSKTLAELLNGDVTIDATDIADGSVTTAKLATQTGNVDFADDGRIRLGDSQDLQIYHNGSNSYIQEIGTGNLFIASDANVNITNQVTTELKATFVSNGAVTLYYDAAQKLDTTSTGVSITGTAISTTTGVASAPNFAVTSGALGVNGMFAPSPNTLAFATSATERMRIDSNGHVGITESSSIDGRLHINSTGQNNATGINILLECTSGGGRQWAHRISETGVNNGWYVIRDQTADKTRIQIHENVYFMINPNNEQTHVRIGTTGAIGTGYAGFELVRTSDNIGVMNIGKTYSGNTSAVKFWYSASQVGSITYSNSATAYNTSSDYRLKENVEYDFDATTRLKQLKPARFNFIEDADTTVDGFLAHEVQDIVPEAITGTKDAMRDEEYEVTPAVEATYDDDGNILTEEVPAVMGTRSVPDYQGIDQGKLVPLLVKSLQEALTKIETLESRLNDAGL